MNPPNVVNNPNYKPQAFKARKRERNQLPRRQEARIQDPVSDELQEVYQLLKKNKAIFHRTGKKGLVSLAAFLKNPSRQTVSAISRLHSRTRNAVKKIAETLIMSILALSLVVETDQVSAFYRAKDKTQLIFSDKTAIIIPNNKENSFFNQLVYILGLYGKSPSRVEEEQVKELIHSGCYRKMNGSLFLQYLTEMVIESEQLLKLFNRVIPELIHSGKYSEDIMAKYLQFVHENLPIDEYFLEDNQIEIVNEEMEQFNDHEENEMSIIEEEKEQVNGQEGNQNSKVEEAIDNQKQNDIDAQIPHPQNNLADNGHQDQLVDDRQRDMDIEYEEEEEKEEHKDPQSDQTKQCKEAQYTTDEQVQFQTATKSENPEYSYMEDKKTIKKFNGYQQCEVIGSLFDTKITVFSKIKEQDEKDEKVYQSDDSDDALM